MDGAWLAEIQKHLPQPDLTILLDIPPEVSARRKTSDRDKYERDLSMLARVRESYLRQARNAGWVRLDADRDRILVAEDVFKAVAAHDVRAEVGGIGEALSASAGHVPLSARAAVSARTSLAPASFNTRAQASSVAPVVLTSSMSTTIRPVMNRDRVRPDRNGEMPKAVRTLRRLADAVNPACGAVARVRQSACTHTMIETPREVAGLIEAAPKAPDGMQRHRHDGIGIAEHVGTGVTHHPGERHGERAAPFVLERVNDVAEGAFIRAAGPAAVHAFPLTPQGNDAGIARIPTWRC